LLSGSCGTSFGFPKDTALHPVRILPFHFRFFVPMAELDHLRRDGGPLNFFKFKRHCSHLYSYERPLLADTILTTLANTLVSGLSSPLKNQKSNRLDCLLRNFNIFSADTQGRNNEREKILRFTRDDNLDTGLRRYDKCEKMDSRLNRE